MLDLRSSAAELRLRKLAVDLKKAYARVSKRISDLLVPFEVAVGEIGETWRPQHYAESFRDNGPEGAVNPPTRLAVESLINGDEAEYILCVARGPEMKCGIYVSACRYRITESEDNNATKGPQVTIKNLMVVPLASLPPPLRLRIPEVLEDFAVAYEKYVRELRKDVLSDSKDDAAQSAAERRSGAGTETAGSTGATEQTASKDGTSRARPRLYCPDGTPFPPEPALTTPT